MSGLTAHVVDERGGASVITLQFGLELTLDVAEQEVQAAINAGGSLLPTDLPAPPVYAKVNPADAPVLTLAVSSRPCRSPKCAISLRRGSRRRSRRSPASASSRISGGQRPAIRIQADTRQLASIGLGLDQLRTTIGNANANAAKGSFDGPTRSYSDQRERPAADGGGLSRA